MITLDDYTSLKFKSDNCDKIGKLIPEYKKVSDSLQKLDSLTISALDSTLKLKDLQLELERMSKNEAMKYAYSMNSKLIKARKTIRVFGIIVGVQTTLILGYMILRKPP